MMLEYNWKYKINNYESIMIWINHWIRRWIWVVTSCVGAAHSDFFPKSKIWEGGERIPLNGEIKQVISQPSNQD